MTTMTSRILHTLLEDARGDLIAATVFANREAAVTQKTHLASVTQSIDAALVIINDTLTALSPKDAA